MKTHIKILFLMLLTGNFLFGQNFPGTFNYQAVARNDDGTAIANTQIVVEVSILQGDNCSENPGGCSVVWQELHYPTTNDYGVFNIDIGAGQSTYAGSSTSFDAIDWNDFAAGNYYVRLRVDFGNSGFGNGLVDMGTVKLQSVPYALSTETAQDIERQAGKVPINLTELQDVNLSGLTNSQILSWNGTNWVNVDASAGGAVSLSGLTDVNLSSPTTNQVLYFDGTNWANTDLQLTQLGDVNIASPANGQVVSFNGTNWSNNSLSINDLSDVNISGVNSGEAIVWNGSQWTNQTISGSSVWTEDASYVYYNGTKPVGIGTSTPTARFDVQLTGDQGVLFSGTFNSSGSVSDFGAGTRMTFFPSLSAFRAGTVDGTQWDNANTGNYSAAFGLSTTASGDYSVAFGRNSVASGNYSLSAGYNTNAQGAYAVAFGYNSDAGGVASLAIGTNNSAVGLNSIVCGSGNNAGTGLSNDNSIVAGNGNNGYSTDALTIGTSNNNYGNNSIVFGESSKTETTAVGAMAGGKGTTARGNYSVVFGEGNTGQAYASLVIGRYCYYSGNSSFWNDTDAVFVVGNGTDPTTRNNALIIRKNGDILTEGTLTESQTNPNKIQTVKNFADILQLNAYYSARGSRNYYGFSADEVEKYFPSLVFDFNDTKTIAYTQFVPLLLETVKQQQQQIIELQTENKDLLKKINELDERLKKLEDADN